MALGLFYPRPKRFASTFKLRTIGKLKLSPTFIRTVLSTSEIKTHADHLLPLFSAIGRQFRSLTFDFAFSIPHLDGYYRLTYPDPVTQTVTQMIAKDCVNLERLNLNSASAAEVSGVLDTLGGDLGRRLLVLHLNGSRESFNDTSATQLATLLTKTDDPLVLQEVRLDDCNFGDGRFTSLYEALQVNRTLAGIEFTGTRYWLRDLEWIRERERIDAALQDQLLQARVPMEMKLAFLSVVADNDSQSDSKTIAALNTLDSSVLTLIFQFAARREVRRVISWNEEVVQRY